MEFSATFKSENSYAVSIPQQSAGITLLDKAREDTGLPKLNPDLAELMSLPTRSNPAIKITEDQARESGLFAGTSTIDVVVDREQLNKFCKLVTETYIKEYTGEVTRVFIEVDRDAIIDAWQNAGYPEDWRTSSGNADE